MRTWRMIFNPKKQKDSVFCQYFLTNTTDARRMYNTANFYIRNTMTGIKKSPELRTSNEVEVLHDVFTGIQKANKARDIKYQKNLEKYNKGLLDKQPKKPKHFPYPTTKEWLLTYNVLDATNVVKFTDLYPGAKSTCQEHYNGKRHESSPASKPSHRYSKDTRLKYRILFGKSKYVYTSAKKSA